MFTEEACWTPSICSPLTVDEISQLASQTTSGSFMFHFGLGGGGACGIQTCLYGCMCMCMLVCACAVHMYVVI